MQKTTPPCPLNRKDIAGLPWEQERLKTPLAIHQKSREPSFWEVMESYFSSVCKFGSLKNLFAMITSLSELYFRFKRFVLLVKMKKKKKRFLWAMAAAQAAENHGDEWGLTWYLQWGIYINSNLNPLTKITSSSRSTKFKDILLQNMSQMITKTIPLKHKNSHKLCSEMGHSILSLLVSQLKLPLHD